MNDIYILGTGQRFPDHLTLEVLEALGQCRKVFTLLTNDALATLPKEIARKCESVWWRYRTDRPRNQNYTEVSELILAAAKQEPPVGWLTLGNPRILDSVSQTLITEGRERGLAVIDLPSVSSIDTVLIDVGYDPASGVLVVEATSALIYQTPFIPEIATLVFQPGVFGTFYPRLNSDDRKIDLLPFRDYLTEFYPSDHQIAFVSSSDDFHTPPKISWTAIEGLNETSSESLRSSTVFIPPTRRGVVNLDFVARVEAAE